MERGPDKEKIRDMQESHGAGTVKYTGLQVFLTSTHNPIGREILVDTVYKVCLLGLFIRFVYKVLYKVCLQMFVYKVCL